MESQESKTLPEGINIKLLSKVVGLIKVLDEIVELEKEYEQVFIEDEQVSRGKKDEEVMFKLPSVAERYNETIEEALYELKDLIPNMLLKRLAYDEIELVERFKFVEGITNINYRWDKKRRITKCNDRGIEENLIISAFNF